MWRRDRDLNPRYAINVCWFSRPVLSTAQPSLQFLYLFKKRYGGEGGIRTLDTLPYTHFPGVLLQPLGHLTTLLPTTLCLSTACNILIYRIRVKSFYVSFFYLSTYTAICTVLVPKSLIHLLETTKAPR